MSSAIIFAPIQVIQKLLDVKHGYKFLGKKGSSWIYALSWQRIFIGYEGKNQYRVHNPRIGKVHITGEIFVDEQHLYHRETLNDWDYAENDWAETDEAQFADVDDFGSLDMDDSSYSLWENTSKQTKKEGNDSQDLEQDLTALDDLESELSDPPEEQPLEINSGSTETSRQSGRARAVRTLYPGQITYGFAPISRKLVNNPTPSNLNLNTPETPSSLAGFTSTRVA